MKLARLAIATVALAAIFLPLLSPAFPVAADSSQHSNLFVNGIEQPYLPANTEAGQNYIVNSSRPVTISTMGVVNGSLTLQGGGTWALSSALNVSGMVAIIDGTFNSASFGIDCDSLYFGEYGGPQAPVAIILGNSRIDCFSFAIRGMNVALNAGTSTINTTLLFDDSAKTGHKYYNVSIASHDSVKGFVEGKSSFNNITFDKGAYVVSDITAKSAGITSGAVESYPTGKNLAGTAKITTDSGVISVARVSTAK